VAGLLLLPLSGVTAHADRLAVHEKSAAERQGDQETVPGLEEFFFEQEKVTGMMGAPERRAAVMTPGCATLPGPRGPSGVNAASHPERILRTISFSPVAPPRVVLPRAVWKPKRFMVRLMNSPSRCSLIRTAILRPG